MKIYFDLPWGGRLYFERQQMDKYKFYTMWVCIAVCVVSLVFFGVSK